ncbi:type II toxin-antitoxin system VapC family toxin [Rugamonas sp.]|uniref:type II toxin-antitoxin system VapC family toxin n=1 Tax=Rugamonas sp. TaxID=1926287 RepID=UPI0025F578A0|nr:type II toxin-antitoxin system VapC family toxin [Rugamonas sp.]
MNDPMPSVYIETSVISYLCARDSRVADLLADQEATRLWWEKRNFFCCFVSNVVIDECGAGHPLAAKKRIAAMHDLPVLMIDERVRKLADLLLNKNIVPAKARLDALHIAIATIHHMNFLLTWNCRHMANGC